MLRMSRHASAQTDRGFNVHDRSARGGRLPARRQQRAEVVLLGHARQALEHSGAGLRAVAAGAFHLVLIAVRRPEVLSPCRRCRITRTVVLEKMTLIVGCDMAAM